MEPFAFGRWQLVARLGAGATGEVFLARDAGGRFAALKRLHAPLCDDLAALGTLLDEARLSARVASPVVARALDVGCVDGRYYAAFEHVRGADLAVVLEALAARGERMAPPLAAAIALRACEGLDALAKAGARAHGDVSPWNLRLGREGEVKLLDLGLGARPSPGESGTPGYAPPEGRASARGDVYALGAILRELLDGVPFAPSVAPAQPARSRGAATPSSTSTLLAIARRACAQDPAARYADAAELARALAPHALADPAPAIAALVREVAGEAAG